MLAGKYTQKIIFVDPALWAPDLSYKNNLIKQYSETIKLIYQKEKLPFINASNKVNTLYEF